MESKVSMQHEQISPLTTHGQTEALVFLKGIEIHCKTLHKGDSIQTGMISVVPIACTLVINPHLILACSYDVILTLRNKAKA